MAKSKSKSEPPKPLPYGYKYGYHRNTGEPTTSKYRWWCTHWPSDAFDVIEHQELFRRRQACDVLLIPCRDDLLKDED